MSPFLRRFGLLLGLFALFGSAGAWAQCASTYTGTGTATTTPGSTAGVYGQYYPGAFHSQPGFSEANPLTFFSSAASGTQRVDATVNFANAGFGNVNGNGTGTPVNFSARYRGSVTLKAGGTYTFYLTSDDASYMFLGKEATLASPTPNNAFIKNGGDHGDVERTNSISVAATGGYDVQVLLGQGGGGVTIRLEYSGGPDNLVRQVVPQTELCAGPSGQTYAVNQAPTVNNVTNATVFANGTANTLTPNLSAFDLDGTVASFQITSVPAAGTLQAGATVITAGNVPFTVSAANLGTLTYSAPVGTAGTFSFQYRATDNLGAQGVAATYTLPVVSNDADLGTVLVATSSTGGGTITTAPQGSLVFYTANVTNSGPATAGNVAITINLPAGLTGISLSNSGVYNAGTGQATFGNVNIGSGATVSRNIAFSMPATTVNATASGVAGGGQTDPNSANNIGSTFTSPTQVADVSVAVNGPTRVLANQAVVYSVVPTNIGPSTATGVALRAQLATGLAGVVASGPGAPGAGSYNAITGVVTWPLINSLANGVSLVYTVRFNSPTTTGGTITASGSATSTTANGDPVVVNNDGTAAQSNITTQVVATAATLLCVVPGADGDINPLPSGFNTYFPGVGAAGSTATSIVLGPAAAGAVTPIVAGDLVLIMQMQGGDLNSNNTDAYGDGVNGDNLAAGVILNSSFTAGVYEYAIAANAVGTAGGTLQITQGLSFSYQSATANAASGQRRFQIIRVPRYRNVTLNANVTAPRWDGITGGVMAMDVDGTLNLAGFKLDMAGRGFRGGAGQQLGGAGGVNSTDYRNSNTLATSANKGEGTVGTPRFLNNNGIRLDTQASGLLPVGVNDGYPGGDRGRGAPGNAGGGATDGRPSNNDQNPGGGGGSNAGRGGVGGNGWDSNSPTGGFGGAGFTQATASRIIMGGGGGGGTTNNGTVASAGTYPANTGIAADGFASSGATGGGIVIIRASAMSPNAGTIDVSGNSMEYVPQNDGSGGAGAGGSVVLLCNASNGNANSPVLQNITILGNGGTGGSNTGGGSPHGPGGGGAGGVSFTSSFTSAASSLAPGPNGTTFGFVTYGSGVGSASLGQSLSSITRADVPNVVVGCPADVVTTISSSATANTPTNTASPNASVTFTANTVNTGLGTALNVRETITIAPNLANVQPNGQSTFVTNGSTGVLTFADGTTYNPATGVVTFPVVASLANGATLVNALTGLPNRVQFSMPNQNVLGTAASTSSGDFDPRLANNDGSLPAANIKVTAVNSIAGTIFDDVNYGGGSGRDLATANAAAVASGFAGGEIGSGGTRVELYNSSNTFIAATTTGADGGYGFSGVPLGSYTVRAVSSTVKSVRNKTATGLVPVQTYRTNQGAADPERVGGEDPTKVDGPANFSSVTLRLAGLNLSGGDNTAFIDQVQILSGATGNTVVAGALSNFSFETPNVGNGFIYGPAGVNVAWTFAGNSGIAGNGSGFGATAAPDGTQVAFIQTSGAADQALNLMPGTYRVRFRAAQRNVGGVNNNQTVAVVINGTQIDQEQPTNSNYGTFTSVTFTVGSVGSGVVTQSVAPLTLAAGGATGVDFGFNFSTVVNTNDTGQGSLRQFILNANALGNGNLDQAASSNAGGANPAAGVETSIFMISDGAVHNGLRSGLINQLTGGVAVITPNTATNGAMPAFTDPNTVLDGTTQTLNVGNSNNVALGAGGTVGTGTALAQVNGPEVQLTGTPGQANSDYGLTLAASNLTVRGFSVLGFGNTGASGTGNLNGANLYVTGAANTGLLISNNVIGTGATAFPTTGTDPNSTLTRSTGHGVLLANFATGGVVSAIISNNLIGYNGASGVENLANGTANSVLISGNEIRSNALLNSTADGVHLGTAGGTVQNSLITGNRGSGVDFAGSAGAILVTGNTISNSGAGGTETSGVRAFGQGNTISLNVITGSAGNGVLVRSGTNAANVEGTTFISRNAITANGQLGIDLLNTGDGETAGTVTLNDLGDTDGGSNGATAVGGNGLLNFPVITQARISGTNLLVRGFSRPGAVIELFGVNVGTNTADGSGFGEGGTYLATGTEGSGGDTNPQVGPYSGLINGRNQGTDNTNHFTLTIPLASLPVALTAGVSILSATATLPGVGTSEYSGIVTVGSGPLPVELTVFTAKAVNLDAALAWTTASEKNNDRFDVERSFSGTDFVKIDEVRGQGSTSRPTDYALTDAGVGAKATGPVYYRLRQVDADGTASYSPVRTVAFGKAAAPAIGLFPNPANGATQLDLRLLPAGAYRVLVLDATGRTVLSATLDGGMVHGLDLNTVASGTYNVLVRGQNGGESVNLTKRLVKN